jgi:hypothetical protein
MLSLFLFGASVLALAQGEPPPGPSAAPQAVRASTPSDELSRFASATVKLHGSAASEPAEQLAIIRESGLTVERYNEIAARMRSNPAFAAQANAALQKALGPSAAAKAEAEEARGALPTSGTGALVLEVLEKVCVPMVRENRPVNAVAPLVGFKEQKQRSGFTRTLVKKPYSLTVFPRGANKDVCQVEVRYPVGDAKAIANALNAWGALHKPELKLRRNDVATGDDGVRRRTLSWEHVEDGSSLGLVFVQENKPDGSPLNPGYDTARLLYSERGESAFSNS